jgi:hypothetical protein
MGARGTTARVLSARFAMSTSLLSRFRSYAARRDRLVVFALVVVTSLAVLNLRRGAKGATVGASLSAVLARQGLEVDPSSAIVLSDEPDVFAGRGVVFRARAPGELYDVYYADVRGPEAVDIRDVAFVTNLTRTSSADEGSLVRSGKVVAFASRVGEEFDAFTLFDMSGESTEQTISWSRRLRVQNAITNLQETGRLAGVGRTRFALLDPVPELRLSTTPRGFAVVGASAAIRVLETGALLDGADLVEVRRNEKAQPGAITWVVDTVRNVSWIGPRPIEWLEHHVFAWKDRFERVKHSWLGSDAEDSREAAADMMAVAPAPAPVAPAALPAAPARAGALVIAEAAVGFPPAPLDPIVSPAMDGEGRWTTVVDPAYVQTYPNAPSPFVQTFIRADAERTYARVYVTLWDARLVDLNVAMGTREPESATGETGSGLIPRTPRAMSRLVAGFNGGFQALHGEFGMMAEGRVYLPPKPWAATVAVYDDGRAAIGSWLGPESERADYDEAASTRQIPRAMVAMRQNLTTVVEDGRYNPWERWWWGAAPEAATEQTYTHRSGLCVTREGFMAYFWGPSMGPEALGAAMNATRCTRGLHLDMNSKHTGLEFYRVARAEEGAPPVRDALADNGAAWIGALPYAEGLAGTWTASVRKAVRSMDPMRFPRYIRRDPRDFFYLMLRPVLPGPAHADGTTYDVRGLPHDGFPYAFARASLPASDPLAIVRIDASRVLAGAAGADPASRGRALAYLAEAPDASASPRALIGVDEEGFLVYVERREDSTLSAHDMRSRAGITEAAPASFDVGTSRLVFCDDTHCIDAFGDETTLASRGDAATWFSDPRPRASALFPEVRPMPYRRWGRLQGARVRYIPEGPPRFVGPASTQ